MALALKKTPLTFSANDESDIQKAITEALSTCVDLNMGICRCAAFPAVNSEHFMCELTTNEVKNTLQKFIAKLKGRLFIQHAVIHFMYIPLILNTTEATSNLMLKCLATGDELYDGTRVNMNEAFVLSMTWPRSLLAKWVDEHRGLYLKGNVHCAPTVPRGSEIGMWYPFWTEQISRKQLYQETVPITNTRALETYARTMIRSDREMRSILRSYASVDYAAKHHEKPVICSDNINLLSSSTSGIDFTKSEIKESGPTTETEILIPVNDDMSRLALKPGRKPEQQLLGA